MNRRYLITVDGKTHDVELIARTPQSISFSVNGKTHSASITTPIDVLRARAETSHAAIAVNAAAPTPRALSAGAVAAPMPGIITKLLCTKGDSVKRGQPLLVIEAMKMENNISAPADGVVADIHVAAGGEVKKGQELLTLKA